MLPMQILENFFCDGASNPYFGHSVRTGNYLVSMFEVVRTSKHLSQLFKQYTFDTVALSGLLHDIGKIEIPLALLTKNGALTKEEWETMRQHSMYGGRTLNHFQVCSVIRRIWPNVQVNYLADTAIYHHERIDGKGYPFGVPKHISPLAKLCAVADTFDAITSDRPYRKGASVNDALEIIKASAGTQLDQEIVDVLLSNPKWAMPMAVCEQYVEKGESAFGNHQEAAFIGNTQAYMQCGDRGVFCNTAR